MLGISIYCKNFKPEYLEKAGKAGVHYVFTSLQIPEDDLTNVNAFLKQSVEICNRYKMVLIPDISPTTFSLIGLKENDFDGIHQMGIKALRLDYGFDDFKKLAQLQTQFELVLNASVVTEAYLKNAKNAGVNLDTISVAHNFYPKTLTGLSEKYFTQKNQLFNNWKIRVIAFIAGDQMKRFPLYEGLPTLEHQRDLPPLVAVMELKRIYGITDIIVGDSQIYPKSMQQIIAFLDENIVRLPAYFYGEAQKFSRTSLIIRKEVSDYVIRLNLPRHLVKIGATKKRFVGAITQLNQLSGRYSGEVNIIKEPLAQDASSNVIGFISPDYCQAIQYLDNTETIIFEDLE